MIKKLKLTMKTLSPLYTGEVREKEKKSSNVNFPVRKTNTGYVMIHLKGKLRSTIEILLKNSNQKTCDTGVAKSRPCGRCYTCELMGSMQKASRLDISFLISTNKAVEITREVSHTRISRENGNIADAFRAEEVIEGSDFNATITMYNYTQDDIDVIKGALKYIEEHGIGGWTRRGYGRVAFDVEEEEVIIKFPKVA